MNLWGGIKSIGKGAWKILDPLTPDEYIGAAGSALHGDWGEAWDKTKTGLKDAVRGAAVGLGGAGLMGAGPLAGMLGGVGSGAAGAIKGVGSAALGGVKAVGGALTSPYGQMAMYGGGGPSLLGLGLGAVNAYSNAKDATRYRGIEDDQINYAKAQQARQQEIQDKILGNLNPKLNVPNLGGLFEDTSNPFYKPSPGAQTPSVPLGGGPGTGGGIPGISGLPPETPPTGGGLEDYQMPLTRGGIAGIVDSPGVDLMKLRNKGPKGISVRARMQ